MQGIIVVLFFYNGSEVEGRLNFKAFFDLGTFPPRRHCVSPFFSDAVLLEPVSDMTREMPYEEVNTLQVSTRRISHLAKMLIDNVRHTRTRMLVLAKLTT
jgi:hypothetical protein